MKTIEKKNIIFIFGAIVIYILFSFNFKSADAEYYKNLYENLRIIDNFSVESGYVFLCKFFKDLGCSYIQFRSIIGFIVITLISSTILKYSKYPFLVLLCYFCYPFLLDCAQVRHMIACSIFIFSIRFLEVYNIKNLICFVVCVLVASSVQIIAFAFLSFISLYFIKNKKALYSICIIGTIILFFSVSIVFNSSVFKYLLGLRNRLSVYESGIATNQLILYLLFYIVLIFMSIKPWSSMESKSNNDISSFLHRFSIFSIIFLPILLIDFQFTRLFRACIIPIYISCWNNISIIRRDYKILVGILFIIICSIVFYKLFISSQTYYDSLTYPIIFENSLFHL